AFNAGDAGAIAALYEEDAIFVQDRQQVVGRDGIREAYRSILANRGTLELSTIRVLESEAGIALLFGQWTHRFGDSVTRGTSVEVVRRQADGRWCFLIDDPYGHSR